MLNEIIYSHEELPLFRSFALIIFSFESYLLFQLNINKKTLALTQFPRT